MRSFITRTGLLVLVCLTASGESAAQEGCTASSHPLSPAGVVPCNQICNCKWRVTWEEWHTPPITHRAPFAGTAQMGHVEQRIQGAEFGRPHTDILLRTHFVTPTLSGQTSRLPGDTSMGYTQWHIAHIDACDRCGRVPVGPPGQRAAQISGWSQPSGVLTASVSGNASYWFSVQIQAAFAFLTQANNNLVVVEQASKDSGYRGQVQGGTAGFQLGFEITYTEAPNSQPNGRLYSTLWARDRDWLTEETLTLLGTISTQAEALSETGLAGSASASLLFEKAVHCAGVRFKCYCGSASPLSPTGFGVLLPSNGGHQPGGTTPGHRVPGVTPPTTPVPVPIPYGPGPSGGISVDGEAGGQVRDVMLGHAVESVVLGALRDLLVRAPLLLPMNWH